MPSSAAAGWCAASCGPAAASASGATPRCCAACVAPRSPSCARRSRPPTSARLRRSCRAGSRFGARRSGAHAQVQGRWSLVSSIFRREPEAGQRRRTLAELLLERYGIVSREQVLAEGIPGGFAILYDALSQLETLGA